MIIEVWIDVPLPGADWGSLMKEWVALMNRLGVNWRLLTPECGVLNRVLHVVEWASYADREKFYSKLPDEASKILVKRKDFFDEAAFEHYYYNVVDMPT